MCLIAFAIDSHSLYSLVLRTGEVTFIMQGHNIPGLPPATFHLPSFSLNQP